MYLLIDLDFYPVSCILWAFSRSPVLPPSLLVSLLSCPHHTGRGSTKSCNVWGVLSLLCRQPFCSSLILFLCCKMLWLAAQPCIGLGCLASYCMKRQFLEKVAFSEFEYYFIHFPWELQYPDQWVWVGGKKAKKPGFHFKTRISLFVLKLVSQSSRRGEAFIKTQFIFCTATTSKINVSLREWPCQPSFFVKRSICAK